ncbi:mitochondrial 18 KDa protein-domain-containing protein [Aspergillus coremiiformis]|uniref:Mitochondrial fission process protein 1 n=1 Tax=Aspergillus coremiiformis TaxID=138285 RepID=A0A5N6YWI2_9EURO|nr:mitochondrial 18 KDa protein-domain-containing protein [Aspergillus coremiiformis]
MRWGSQPKHDDSPEKPITREKLPPQLQKLVDHDDGFYDDIYSSYSVDSTETPYRYAGYANRLRTILLSAHRYVAYTSDIGESFRPVAHPYLVRSAYAVSWSYLIGDVVHEGYKAYLRNRHVLAPPGEAYKDAKADPSESPTTANTLEPWPTMRIPLLEDYRMVMAKRAVFQSIASMGLPALTIHSVVKYSGRALKNSKSVVVRTWAPIGLGLSVVPFLPYIFDEPVDEAVEWSFRSAVRAYAGEDAVRPLPHPETVDVLREKNEDVAAHSWEEYKEERRRAREQRKKELSDRGQKGPWAVLGFGRTEDPKKTD